MRRPVNVRPSPPARANDPARSIPALQHGSTAWAAPLVGRDDCVGTLAEAVKWVAGGRFGVVEVSGEPGIGKTRVLAEAARIAGESAFEVWSGRATRFEPDAPLAVFAEAPRHAGATAHSLFDLLRSGSADKVRGYDAMRRDLADKTGTGVGLLLDDLHWADHASLELIEYLIRNPPPAPMLVVAAFRSAQPPIRIVDAISRAGTGVWQIRLGPLAERDLQALVPHRSSRRRGLLWRASLGNPLHVHLLAPLTDTELRDLIGEPGGELDNWADESVRQIRHTLAVDLAELDATAQQVAQAIAVIGDRTPLDLVAHVADLPVSAVQDAVDRLCAAGIGELDGAWFAFRYPLMRAAAHDLAAPAWRLRAHARAAEYLRCHDGPLLLLAHHVERAAQYGDETAAAILFDAGRSMVYRAPGTAVRWLGKALRILSPVGRLRSQRPGIMLACARALGLAGELDRSWEMLQELLRDGHPLHAEAAAFAVVIARLRGDLDKASALLDDALRTTGNQPRVEGGLQIQLATLSALRENATAVARHTRRALELLDGRRPALGAAAHALRAWAALHEGQPAAARTHAREAVRLVDTVSDVTLCPHVELLSPLAWVEMLLGELDTATRHLGRAYDAIDQTGHSSALPYLLIVDAATQSRLGRLSGALDLADQAALAADRMGSPEIRAMADTVRLRPLLWTEGPAAVLAIARRLEALARPRSRAWWRVARLNLALAHAAAGNAQPCLDVLTDPGLAEPADPPATVIRHVTLAYALAGTSDILAASRAAADAESIADAAGLDYEIGLARHAQACVAAQAGQLDKAGVLADQSAAMFAAVQAPVEEGRAHHLAATVLARAGQFERGHEELGRAKAAYAACDATWLLTMLTRDQRRHAARRSRKGSRTDNTDLSLTVRERQIADLVAAGLTNQEIANQLFISRRTVESHLSRIFPKLDVRSRAGLVHRLGKP